MRVSKNNDAMGDTWEKQTMEEDEIKTMKIGKGSGDQR